jgi:hypothetical protein
MSLIEAVLQNATLSPDHRAAVYLNAAEYQGLIRKRHQRALGYARLAMESAPRDLRYHFYYIIWLMNVGDLDTAEKELEIARQKDIFFTRYDLITRFETRLEQLRAGNMPSETAVLPK